METEYYRGFLMPRPLQQHSLDCSYSTQMSTDRGRVNFCYLNDKGCKTETENVCRCVYGCLFSCNSSDWKGRKTDILTLKRMDAETGCLVHTIQGEEITALCTVWSVRVQQKTFIFPSCFVSITAIQEKKLPLLVYNKSVQITIDELLNSNNFPLIRVMITFLVGSKAIQHGKITVIYGYTIFTK